MNIFIAVYITTMLSLFVGYWFGRSGDVFEDARETYHGVKRSIKRVTTPSISTGVIKPKTAQELLSKELPKQEREGLDAMREALAESPEIATHKKLLDDYKKSKAQQGIYL